MPYPETIPIAYEPDYHTDTIGRWTGGQFLGGVIASFHEGYTHADDWPAHKYWYAILHTFDHDGNHLDSKIEEVGTDTEHDTSVNKGKELVGIWLQALPGVTFEDISIRPFRVEFSSVVFGLILESDDETEWAELYPNNIGFYEPWDGSYDT